MPTNLAVGLGNVNSLENTDRESTSLSGTGLGLGEDITLGDDRHDGTLLDRRGLLETIGCTEKETHQQTVQKCVNKFKILTVDTTLKFHRGKK